MRQSDEVTYSTGLAGRAGHQQAGDLAVAGAVVGSVVVVVGRLLDQIDRLGGGHLVVARTVALHRVGEDRAVLLRDVEPVVGTELERGRVVAALAGQAGSVEGDGDVAGAEAVEVDDQRRVGAGVVDRDGARLGAVGGRREGDVERDVGSRAERQRPAGEVVGELAAGGDDRVDRDGGIAGVEAEVLSDTVCVLDPLRTVVPKSTAVGLTPSWSGEDWAATTSMAFTSGFSVSLTNSMSTMPSEETRYSSIPPIWLPNVGMMSKSSSTIAPSMEMSKTR